MKGGEVERVKGIEANENKIPRFPMEIELLQSSLRKLYRGPNSPYVSVILEGGDSPILRSVISVFLRGIGDNTELR